MNKGGRPTTRSRVKVRKCKQGLIATMVFPKRDVNKDYQVKEYFAYIFRDECALQNLSIRDEPVVDVQSTLSSKRFDITVRAHVSRTKNKKH